MIYEIYSIYRNSGRPDRFISSHASLEEARAELERVASNELDENNYRIVERRPDQDATYQDDRNFEYFCDDVNLY